MLYEVITEIEDLLERIETQSLTNLNNSFVTGLIEDHPDNAVVLLVRGVKNLFDDDYEQSIAVV